MAKLRRTTGNGTLISLGEFRAVNVSVSDSPALLPMNQRALVDTSTGTIDINLFGQARNGDKIVIVDKNRTFDDFPLTLHARTGVVFHQTGTDEYELGMVGQSSEWVLRYESGIWYTEVAPAYAQIEPQGESIATTVDDQSVFTLVGEITDPDSVEVFYNGWKVPDAYYTVSGSNTVTITGLPITILAGSTLEFYYD